MDKEILLNQLSLNGKLVTKRCTESFLRKIGAYDWLCSNTPVEFTTVSDKIKWQIYGGGYCAVCNTRTKLDVSGRGFARYCKDHFHHAKKGKIAHNSKSIDIDTASRLYIDGRKSIAEIAEILGDISNVTLKKKLVAAGIPIRSHSDNQSIQSGSKGKRSHDYPPEWWQDQYNTKSSEQIASDLQCSPSLVLRRLHENGIDLMTFGKDSTQEQVILNFLDSMEIPYRKKVRGMLDRNLELDVVIDQHKLAIEINGIYWHSESQGKTSQYHLNKTNQCLSKGYKLLHFWDSEIIHHPEIVQSMIGARLGLNSRVFARQCSVREIDSTTSRQFFESTHLQGYVPASKTIGLYYKDNLVCAGSFMKPRYDRKYDWELIRFSSALNVTVVGGLSRILSRISGSILSYANRRWSCGGVYDQCGFTQIRVVPPGYYYTKDFRTIESRLKYQKHRLKSSDHYDPNLSEREIMALSGYSRLWDCGQLAYVLHK